MATKKKKEGAYVTDEEILALFDRYHDMAYRLALSCTGSPQDAEDVVQTIFLRLLEGKNPPQPGKERPWLAQAAVNASRDILRSFWRRRTQPLDEAIPFQQEEESALFAAVMALPAKYRVVVHLHYYEGYTLQEIAGFLRKNPSTVSMRLHRARKLLRSSLKEDDYGPIVSEDL